MARSLFIDESKAKGYRLAATLIDYEHLAAARTRIQRLVLPGQRRIHFSKESDRRRKHIISELSTLAVTTHIYQVSHERETEARRLCLATAVNDIIDKHVTRIVVEIDPSIVNEDRRTLSTALRLTNRAETIQFHHEQPEAEPLLWVPDAIAWCHARDATWRRRIAPLLSGVTRIQP